MKPNEAMRALPIEDEAAYGQSDKRMCQLIFIRCTGFRLYLSRGLTAFSHFYPAFLFSS